MVLGDCCGDISSFSSSVLVSIGTNYVVSVCISVRVLSSYLHCIGSLLSCVLPFRYVLFLYI